MLQVVKSLNTSLGRINPNQNWASQAFSTTIAIAYSAIASVAAVAVASWSLVGDMAVGQNQ